MRIIPWVDPFTNEPLEETDTHLIHKNSKYPIIDGIPKFVQSESNDEQYKIQKCFSYQWTKSDFGQPEKFSNDAIRQDVLETMDLTEEDLALFNDKLVLDVGVGSGASSRLWSSQAKEFHGIDIGDGIYRAKNTLKDSIMNPVLSHADLHHLPYKDESFDVIVSNGVLHHTPNTKNALKSIYPKLKKGGIIIFYIYKVKAPLREFSDDYIRNLLSNLSPEEAFEKTKSITKLAESLHNQQIRITIPEDVPLLGFKKGEYDLQRFIYQNIFKLFWKKSMGFYESNMENFDWYYPKYSWRHTEQEIKDWCTEFNLTPKLIKENYSGFTCHALRE
jgi:ubiquinone/menaquinone biosynthesis C-methylase UbiE